jgi:hypothetical protein
MPRSKSASRLNCVDACADDGRDIAFVKNGEGAKSRSFATTTWHTSKGYSRQRNPAGQS